MTKEDLRKKFLESGLSYSDLNKSKMKQLFEILNTELSTFKNHRFTMKVRGFRMVDVEYNLDGSLVKCYLTVKGMIENESNHFNRREAISFNPDGFIGFAGWSDSTNIQPFLRAFDKWINTIKL